MGWLKNKVKQATNVVSKVAQTGVKLSNPINAIKGTRNIVRPGGSVLGKTFDSLQDDFGINAKEGMKAIGNTSIATGKLGNAITKGLGIGGKIGSYGNHLQNLGRNNIEDPRGTFIGAGKKVGVAAATYFSGGLAGGMLAGAGGALAQGALAGGIVGAANGAAQGRGFENTVKQGAMGAVGGGLTSGLGPATNGWQAAGQGALRGGVNAGMSGGSIAEGALAGAAGSGASFGANQMAGGGTLGRVAGNFAGSMAGNAVRNQFADTPAGQSQPQPPGQPNQPGQAPGIPGQAFTPFMGPPTPGQSMGGAQPAQPLDSMGNPFQPGQFHKAWQNEEERKQQQQQQNGLESMWAQQQKQQQPTMGIQQGMDPLNRPAIR